MTTNNGTAAVAAAAALELRGVTAGYGRTIVVRDVELVVRPGAVVALLGANGAGKTTLLRVAAGQLRPEQGAVIVGGRDATNDPVHKRARAGLCLVPDGRGIFPRLTVRENLELQLPDWQDDASMDVAIGAFPKLGERLSQVAGTLSGGEQQMLALSRAFVQRPDVVMLDEVSLGLAPRVVEQIFESLDKLAQTGAALLLVEQYINRALEVAAHVYVLSRGSVAVSAPPAEIDQEALLQGYLGTAKTA